MVVGRPSAQAMEPVRFCKAKKRRWNAVRCVADGGGLGRIGSLPSVMDLRSCVQRN
jgi:hypothetical protein